MLRKKTFIKHSNSHKMNIFVTIFSFLFVLFFIPVQPNSIKAKELSLSAANSKSFLRVTSQVRKRVNGHCIQTSTGTCGDSTECISDPDSLNPCDGDYECMCMPSGCTCMLKVGGLNQEQEVDHVETTGDTLSQAQSVGAQDVVEEGLKRGRKATKLLTKVTGPLGKLLTPALSFYKGFKGADGSVLNKIAHGTVGSCKELDDMGVGFVGGAAAAAAGTAVGAKVGVLGGVAGVAGGAVVGGLVGGIAGGYAAAEAYDGTEADRIADQVCEDKLCDIKCNLGKVKSWFGGGHDHEGCMKACHEEKAQEVEEKAKEVEAQIKVGSQGLGGGGGSDGGRGSGSDPATTQQLRDN